MCLEYVSESKNLLMRIDEYFFVLENYHVSQRFAQMKLTTL